MRSRSVIAMVGLLLLVACGGSTSGSPGGGSAATLPPPAGFGPGAPKAAPISPSNQAAILVLSGWLRQLQGDAAQCGSDSPLSGPGSGIPQLHSRYSASVNADSKAMDPDVVSRGITSQGGSPNLDGKWTQSTDVYTHPAEDRVASFTVPGVSVKGLFEIRHLSAEVTPAQPLPADQDNRIVWRGKVVLQGTAHVELTGTSVDFGTNPPKSPAPGFSPFSESYTFAATNTGGHLTPVDDSGQPTSLGRGIGTGCAPTFFPWVGGYRGGSPLQSALSEAAYRACITATPDRDACARASYKWVLW